MKNIFSLGNMKVITGPSTSEYVVTFKKKLEEEGVSAQLIKYITPITLIRLFILRFFGYEIFHLHFVHSFPSIRFMKIFVSFAKFIGYKIVWTGHSIYQPEKKERSIKKTKWFYEHSDLRFIHHKAHLKLLKDIVGINEIGKIKMIFHPLFDIYPNTVSKREARKKLGVPENKKVMLILGDIKEYKGIKYLIDAAKNLGNRYYLIIAGRSSDENLIKYIEQKQSKMNNIKLVNHYIPQEEVQYYMNACDIFVLPYTLIWTSGAVKLAYAFSRPVVSTQVGTMPEVVTDETGILVKPRDAHALAEGIEKLFSMDYEQMGKKTYEMMKKNYSWKKLIDLTIEGYLEIIKKTD